MNITIDVLVVGAGGAGSRAAIAAADSGASVLLVSKKEISHAGATSYPIAEMAGYNAGDVSVPMDVQQHYRDIIEAGQGMADEELASIVASRAPETIHQLERWGVQFEMEQDGYYIFKSCFSNSPRTHVIKGHGEPIIRALDGQIRMRSNIKVLEGITVMGLSIRDGICVGAYGCMNGEIIDISAKAVVLATGGCGQAFERNMNPSDVTGDGYSMAYHAGAELVNMEFMQIGMGFSWPVVNIFNGYLWEAKPKLRDRDGNEIFSDVLPEGLTADAVMHEHRKHFPFSSSDDSKYLEAAVQKAIQEGRGTDHRGIRADLSHMTDAYVESLQDDCGIHHMWPIARDYMKSRGVDLLHDEVEVACYAHAVNGGVKIDKNARSVIPGLYAAGECAGGPHGADRLGGNMMVTCQVFGTIAGTSAAEYAMRQYVDRIDSTPDLHREEMKNILYKNADRERMLKQLKRSAQDHLLVGRSEEGLMKLKNLVGQLMKELQEAPDGEKPEPGNVDLYHMLTTIGIMAESALGRRESRGSHHRADYPQRDDRFAKPVVIRKNGGHAFQNIQ